MNKKQFAKSTLKGVVRKGFIKVEELEKTKLPQFTRDEIKKYTSEDSLLFVRDKQCLFIITGSKVFYSEDSNLLSYIEYFKEKNPQFEYTGARWTPEDLRARGLKVDKIAEDYGFSL